jgi:hypothetical protein
MLGMRLRFVGSCLLGAIGLAACSSWSGPTEGDVITDPDNPIGERDGSVPDIDGGKQPAPDAGRPDAGPPDAAQVDAGRLSTLGDDRAGYEHCGEADCGETSICCTQAGDGPTSRWCQAVDEADAGSSPGCGLTRGWIACDGPEDCDGGKVCCHTTTQFGVRSECVDGEVAASDASAAVRSCAGPNLRVACHADDDCRDETGAPLCRAAPASGGIMLGYCKAEYDDPRTPGHDDQDFVGCGLVAEGTAGTSCNLDDRICCASSVSADLAACDDVAACGQGEIPVRCDGAEDCEGGAFCCQLPEESTDGGVKPRRVDCAASCEPELRRCHAKDECGDGMTCEPDQASPWWGSCVPEPIAPEPDASVVELDASVVEPDAG